VSAQIVPTDGASPRFPFGRIQAVPGFHTHSQISGPVATPAWHCDHVPQKIGPYCNGKVHRI
jgi:hypothetical protein